MNSKCKVKQIKEISQQALFFLIIMLFFQNILSAQINLFYEPIEGKIIGVWPHNNRLKSLARLTELKERWGFHHLLIAAIYDEKEIELAKQAGFDPEKIVKQIYLPDLIEREEWLKKNILNSGKVGAYYFDEPISRKHSYIGFLNFLIFLADEGFYPSAKFYVSELDERKAVRVLNFVDEIMYSGYGRKEKLGLDQIETWKNWQNYLGEKFSFVWIAAHEDSNEYRTLFKAAKELGFRGVWFYQLEPLDEGQEVSDSNFEKFCEAAVEFGFLKRKE